MFTWVFSLGLAVSGAQCAQAACSRVIQVPVSATGQRVVIDGDAISGIYPDLLRGLSGKEGCTFALSAVSRARLEALFESGRADLLIPASKIAKRDAAGTFVAVVRGFDYGVAYQEMVTALGQQGRLILGVDAVSVARLLKVGTADLTIMAPSILAGAIQGDERVRDLLDKLRVEPLEDLPWGYSGVYIFNTALSQPDKATLQSLLEHAARFGEVWKGFQRYYSPAIHPLALTC